MNSIGLSSRSVRTVIDKGELDPIYRKIVFRIVPILMVLWVLAWIDRINVSFAKLQMMEELRFSETVYGLGAGIFYIGYLIFEVPSNLLLQKVGARRTIARIAIGWGLVCILMSHATTPIAFYALRFLLGAFEAGFFPGVIVYLTLWFPSDRRAKVFGIFMSSVAFSGVLGGPIAGYVMSAFHEFHGLSGWQWLFIIEGIPTLLVGLFALLYLTDRLDDAHWLTPAEREAVATDLARDSDQLGQREHSLQALLRDHRIWTLTAIYFCVIVANATVAFWGPTIVRDTGVTDVASIGWIVSGASLLGSLAMILNGFAADRTGRPLHRCIASLLVAAMAFVVIAFSVEASTSVTIMAFAFALAGAYGAIPVFWQIPNRLFAGTAAAAGIAMINSIGNLGGFLAPYGLGMLKTQTGGMTGGLVAVGVIILIAAFALVAVVRRFFPDGAA